MKNRNLGFVCILAASLAFASCSNSEKKMENNASTPASTNIPKELTDLSEVSSYYECPMKCEGKKFSEAGACPVCGMELVLVEVKADSTQSIADTLKQM